MVGILAGHETKRRDLAVALDQPGQKGHRATHTAAGLILGDPDLEWSSGDLTLACHAVSAYSLAPGQRRAPCPTVAFE